jgi:hypothetical protein
VPRGLSEDTRKDSTASVASSWTAAAHGAGTHRTPEQWTHMCPLSVVAVAVAAVCRLPLAVVGGCWRLAGDACCGGSRPQGPVGALFTFLNTLQSSISPCGGLMCSIICQIHYFKRSARPRGYFVICTWRRPTLGEQGATAFHFRPFPSRVTASRSHALP